MAVPGADWRKSTDGYRTGTPYRACSDRSGTDGSPAASNPRTNGDGQTIAGTLADNTGKSEHVEVLTSTETGDSAAPEPLAIEVSAGTAVATEWPGDGHADNVDAGASGTVGGSAGIQLRRKRHLFALFYAPFRDSTMCGDRHMMYDRAPEQVDSRGGTTDQTVIIK